MSALEAERRNRRHDQVRWEGQLRAFKADQRALLQTALDGLDTGSLEVTRHRIELVMRNLAKE